MTKKQPALPAAKKRHLPKAMTPELAQVVLEDAVLEAAADIAALTVTLDASTANPLDTEPVLLVAETREEEEILDLIGVPYLGPTRVQALAQAGIQTLADLHSATPDQIGGVKGVGMGNAARIKAWLAEHPLPQAPAPLNGALSSSAAPAIDPALAAMNQDIQDLFVRLDSATRLLKAALSPAGGVKRLERQLGKLDGAASELAEGPDTLTARQLQKALKTLEKVVVLLEKTAGGKKLSAKTQDQLADDLKARRRQLENALTG